MGNVIHRVSNTLDFQCEYRWHLFLYLQWKSISFAPFSNKCCWFFWSFIVKFKNIQAEWVNKDFSVAPTTRDLWKKCEWRECVCVLKQAHAHNLNKIHQMLFLSPFLLLLDGLFWVGRCRHQSRFPHPPLKKSDEKWVNVCILIFFILDDHKRFKFIAFFAIAF